MHCRDNEPNNFLRDSRYFRWIDRLIENIRLPGMQSDEHLSVVWSSRS